MSNFDSVFSPRDTLNSRLYNYYQVKICQLRWLFSWQKVFFRETVDRWKCSNSANICFFKVNNRNTGKRCEICSKFKIRDIDVLLVFLLFINFGHILQLFLVFALLNLNKEMLVGLFPASTIAKGSSQTLRTLLH